MREKARETDVRRSSAIGVSHPSTKLIEVRPGKQIVARSQGLSTRRNFVLLAQLSLVSSKSKQKSLFGEECQEMRVVYERCCGLYQLAF